MTDAEQHTAAVRAGVAWTGTATAHWLDYIGLRDWGDFAALLACVYSIILIGDWIYKRFFRGRDVPTTKPGDFE